MKISKLKSQDKLYYNELALSYGTLFNTIEWTSIFDSHVYRYGIYDKGDRLIGGFITYKENKSCLSVYRNPPYTPHIGPFLKIDASNPVSVMDTWKKVLSLISDFIEKLPYSVVSISFNKKIIDMQPFIWNKFKVVPVYTYLLELSRDIEDILKGMSNERRKNISKGLKDGLITKKVDDVSIIRSLVLKTYSRQEKKTNEYFLDKVLFEFADKDNSFAFVTYQNNSAIACAFCVYDRHTAYYLMGGYDNENRHHGAGAMSMWESIKHAKNIGLRHFDFEGSMIPQIERYFRGFGGQLTPYFTINKAKLPLEIALKLIKRDRF